MPLSPNVQRIVSALTVKGQFEVPEGATDEQALALSADHLAKADKVFGDLEDEVLTLSGDVTRLKAELAAAKAEATAKANEVLTLSADLPKPFDPLAAEQLGEMVDATFEAAVAAGMPARAVEALRPALRDDKGGLTVFALSGCAVPAGEGKTKASRNALVVANVLKGLAEGKYGEGVPTGPAKKPAGATLQMSADEGADPQNRAPSEDRMKQLREKAGVTVA